MSNTIRRKGDARLFLRTIGIVKEEDYNRPNIGLRDNLSFSDIPKACCSVYSGVKNDLSLLLSVCLSACLSVCVCVCVSLSLYVCLSVSVCLSVCLCLSLFLSLSLSLSLSL